MIRAACAGLKPKVCDAGWPVPALRWRWPGRQRAGIRPSHTSAGCLTRWRRPSRTTTQFFGSSRACNCFVCVHKVCMFSFYFSISSTTSYRCFAAGFGVSSSFKSYSNYIQTDACLTRWRHLSGHRCSFLRHRLCQRECEVKLTCPPPLPLARSRRSICSTGIVIVRQMARECWGADKCWCGERFPPGREKHLPATAGEGRPNWCRRERHRELLAPPRVVGGDRRSGTAVSRQHGGARGAGQRGDGRPLPGDPRRPHGHPACHGCRSSRAPRAVLAVPPLGVLGCRRGRRCCLVSATPRVAGGQRRRRADPAWRGCRSYHEGREGSPARRSGLCGFRG